MKRREFIAGLGSAAAWPVAAGAQQRERVRRIGVVMAYAESDPNGQMQVAAFRQQLQKLGWLEGNNLQIDFRYAADDPARIRALAIELLGMSPDLMVSNSNFVTAILQSEVRKIPLVFVSVSDPEGSGFVTNLARPTGNVTGFANKLFEQLAERSGSAAARAGIKARGGNDWTVWYFDRWLAEREGREPPPEPRLFGALQERWLHAK